MSENPPVEMNVKMKTGLREVWGMPMLSHCNYFNASHQRYIEDPHYVDSESLLRRSAAESAYVQNQEYLSSLDNPSWEDAIEFAEFIFPWGGFGKIDFSDVDEDGGTVVQPYSHYGEAIKANEGKTRDLPGEYFDQGFVAGTLLSASKVEGLSYNDTGISVNQTESISTGDDVSRYEIEPTGTFDWIKKTEPVIDDPHTYNGEVLDPGVESTVDVELIHERMKELDIHGNEQGLVPMFGLTISHGHLDYYMKSLGRLLQEVKSKFGTIDVVKDLIREIGHVCAFYTAGGLIKSPQWEALCADQVDTREDIVHAIVAVINMFGWGRWVTREFEPGERFVFDGFNSFESVGYRKWFGEADEGIDYISCGGTAGTMNLLYYGDITRDDFKINNQNYKRLFNHNEGFVGWPEKSESTGDELTRLVIEREKEG